MNTTTVIYLLLSVHLIAAQLNFEGNPLTENTDYLAEESHFSERTARQQNPENVNDPSGKNHVSSKASYQPGSPQKLYPVYSKDLGREVLIIQSGTQAKNSEFVQSTKINQNSGPVQNSGTVQNAGPVQNSVPIQNLEPKHNAELEKKLQDSFINTNVIHQEQSYQQQTISPADLALQMFLNSKTQKESEVALNYYLQGGQGLAEQLELEKQQQQKLRQEEQMRQQQVQQEQMRQKQIQQEQIKQQQIQQEQIRQQQIQQEQLRQKQLQQAQQEYLQQQQIQQQRVQPLKHLEQQHLNQDQLFRQQNLQPQIEQNLQPQIQQNLQPQIQQNPQQVLIQSQQQIQLQNQQQTQPQQTVNPPQVPEAYPQPQTPFIQPRADFYPGVPIYRRPLRRHSYRQPVPVQSRIGPGIYKGVPPPPIYPGKMMKPPVEIIYSRPPAYARGAPVFSGPPGQYEDASPWFPESDHQPPSKDIYYSQLYAQSYDPHYYNYIAKTGKIKPQLYGKLNPEENQGEGILAELYQGFKNHGIKNIMNPTFLLGMTIPALTFMLTALVQKRSLARSDSRSFDQEEIREYLERLQRALECHRNSRGGSDDHCWR